MKKILLFAAAATMLAACSKDTTEDVAVLPDGVLRVSIAEDDDSRVQLDNGKTVWTQGDKVSVFNKTFGNECYKFNGKTGDRSGTLSKYSGSAGSKTSKVVAMYPYDKNCAISGTMISTTLPATQTYRTNSFGEGGNIMVAVSDDDNLQFKHVFGWIKLSLIDDLERNVEYITFCGNNGEKLAGSVIIDSDTQKTYISGNNTSLILDCGEGVLLSADVTTNFYIAVVPQTFTAGVSIKVRMTDGTSLKKDYKESFTITRNHIQPIKSIDFQSANDMIIYKTSDNSKIITKTDGFGANFISNTYDYKKRQGVIEFDGDITIIPNGAFRDCEKLTSITIPNSVEEIKNSAFYGCSNLTSIIVPNGVTTIGSHAFSNCSSLTSIVIPDSVNSIEDYAFSGCSRITDFTIPDGVSSIGDWAFQSCSSLTSITFLGYIEHIGGWVFRNCNNLTGVYITDIAKWCAIKFEGESNPLTLAHNLYINGTLVTDLIIPDGVTAIGDCAFSGCNNITSVTIPDSVKTIGDSAFSGCNNLIFFCGKYSSPDLRCLIVNGRLINIARFGLTEYTIPDGVTTIGNSAFSGCSKITSITIPDSVTEIGNAAFSSCSSLTNITIPDNVTSIGNSAFYGCNNMINVTIARNATTIGWRAFYNCSNLNKIYCRSIIPPNLKLETFRYISANARIYVPRNSVDTYKTAANWSDYASKIVGYDF